MPTAPTRSWCPTTLTESYVQDWSPDGSSLVVYSNFGLYTLKTDGGQLRRLDGLGNPWSRGRLDRGSRNAV